MAARDYTRAGHTKQVELLNQAITLDRNFAQAHASLTYVYVMASEWFMRPAEATATARAEATTALEIDDSAPDAHLA